MINTAVQQVIREMKAHPFTLVVILALVAVAAWGWAYYARAADIEDVKAELTAQIADLSLRITGNNTKVDRVFKLSLAESIRTVHNQQCASVDERTIEALQQTLDDLQEDFKNFNNGKGYELTRCPGR